MRLEHLDLQPSGTVTLDGDGARGGDAARPVPAACRAGETANAPSPAVCPPRSRTCQHAHGAPISPATIITPVTDQRPDAVGVDAVAGDQVILARPAHAAAVGLSHEHDEARDVGPLRLAPVDGAAHGDGVSGSSSSIASNIARTRSSTAAAVRSSSSLNPSRAAVHRGSKRA